MQPFASSAKILHMNIILMYPRDNKHGYYCLCEVAPLSLPPFHPMVVFPETPVSSTTDTHLINPTQEAPSKQQLTNKLITHFRHLHTLTAEA